MRHPREDRRSTEPDAPHVRLPGRLLHAAEVGFARTFIQVKQCRAARVPGFEGLYFHVGVLYTTTTTTTTTTATTATAAAAATTTTTTRATAPTTKPTTTTTYSILRHKRPPRRPAATPGALASRPTKKVCVCSPCPSCGGAPRRLGGKHTRVELRAVLFSAAVARGRPPCNDGRPLSTRGRGVLPRNASDTGKQATHDGVHTHTHTRTHSAHTHVRTLMGRHNTLPLAPTLTLRTPLASHSLSLNSTQTDTRTHTHTHSKRTTTQPHACTPAHTHITNTTITITPSHKHQRLHTPHQTSCTRTHTHSRHTPTRSHPHPFWQTTTYKTRDVLRRHGVGLEAQESTQACTPCGGALQKSRCPRGRRLEGGIGSRVR